MEAVTVNCRDDFAEWAVARVNAILKAQGSDLATAARAGEATQIDETANALGQAIVDALLEAFDGLVDEA